MADEIANGTFDADLTGWQASGSGASIAHETTTKRTGAGSAKVTVTTAYTGMVQDHTGATAGRTYTASMWVRSGTYAGDLYLQVTAYDSGWAVLDQTSAAVVDASATWAQATTAALVAPAGTAHLEVGVRTYEAGTGTFFADDAVLDGVDSGGGEVSGEFGTFDADVADWQATGTGASIAHETTTVRTGAGSCKVTVTTAYTGLAYDYTAPVVGRTYTASGWVRSGTYTGDLYVQVTAYDAAWGTLEQTSAAVVDASATWAQAAAAGLVCPEGTAHLEVAFRTYEAGAGTFFVDDAALDGVDVGGPDPYPLADPVPVRYRRLEVLPGSGLLVNIATVTRSGLDDVRAADEESVSLHGPRAVSVDVALSSDDDCAALAAFHARRRSRPAPVVSQVEAVVPRASQVALESLAALDLGDLVAVERTTRDSRGLEFSATVEGLQWDLAPGRQTLVLSTAPSDTYGLYGSTSWFVLGESLLGGTAVLAPY